MRFVSKQQEPLPRSLQKIRTRQTRRGGALRVKTTRTSGLGGGTALLRTARYGTTQKKGKCSLPGLKAWGGQRKPAHKSCLKGGVARPTASNTCRRRKEKKSGPARFGKSHRRRSRNLHDGGRRTASATRIEEKTEGTGKEDGRRRTRRVSKRSSNPHMPSKKKNNEGTKKESGEVVREKSSLVVRTLRIGRN